MAFIITSDKTPTVNPKVEGPRLKALAEERIREELGPLYDLSNADIREAYRARAEALAEEFFGPEWDIAIMFTVGEPFAKVVVQDYFN